MDENETEGLTEQTDEGREIDKPADPEEPDTRIAEAIAATIGVEVEDLNGWVVTVDASVEGGQTCRTMWSGNATPWGVRGLLREGVKHAENL